MTTPKKDTGSKAPAAKKSSTPRQPRKTAITIRNLRGTVVHLRLRSLSDKDPFRIALTPRGRQGDYTVVPANLTDDPTLVQALGVLVEQITQSEARQLSYGPVGYLGRSDAPQIIRDEDSTVTSADNWDGTGRRAPDQRNVQHHERGSEMDQSDRANGTGMNVVDVPGSDSGLHAQIREAAQAADAMGQNATPEGVDVTSRRVVVERVKGQ